jgi:hypothetical protein
VSHSNFPRRLEQSSLQMQQRSGLPFSSLLSTEKVASVLAPLQARFRERVFSPIVTLWTFLSQCLSQDHSCREAVVRVVAWKTANGEEPCSADTSGYCQARKRLPGDVLRTLVRNTGQEMQAQAESSWLWKGRSVKIIDGTTVTMPDTKANQQAYPRRRHQANGVGFPIVRLVVLFSLACGAALNLAFGATLGKLTGETTLFRKYLLEKLSHGDILLGDRLFDSFRDIAALLSRGVDVVLRMNASRHCDFRRGHRHGAKDHVVVWKKPHFDPSRFTRADYDELPDELTMRELRFHVPQRGFRSKEIVVVATLLDAQTHTAEEIAELYRQRWHAEIDLNALKTTLNMEHLRCRTPAMIEKEIWAHFLAYNLLRQTMTQAARKENTLPRELSFKGALQTVTAFAPYLAQATLGQDRLLEKLLQAIATHRVADRPDRYEPRKLKKRPGQYTYMTQSRSREREKLCA